MKGTSSRLAFALALTVILTLTLLLTFLLALLANLFLSLLRRRERQCREESPLPEPTDRPLSFPFYGHGVIQAPTKFLLSIPTLEEAMAAQASPSPPPVDDFVCISNPIYDGASRQCGAGGPTDDGGDSTPFVTPKASPSGLAVEEEEDSADYSPPLKLMKKLPPAPPKTTSAACLVDGRQSLGTSTETNRPSSSSSSSNTLCSSPSW